MTESVGQSGKATRALYVATAVLFIAVLVSGALAPVERTRDPLRSERSVSLLEEEFVLSLSAFLSVAAVAVYGIRRRRGGRAQQSVADPLRSLEIGLAVGLALTAAVIASWLITFGWLLGPTPFWVEPRLRFTWFVDLVAGAPGAFAGKAFYRFGFFYVGLEYFETLSYFHRPEPIPHKPLQLWIEFSFLNTLGWLMLLSPAIHVARWRSGRRSLRNDDGQCSPHPRGCSPHPRG